MSNQKNQKANEKTDLPETFTQDSDSAVQVQVSALLEELHQINREDNPEAYADAQVNLGNLYDFQGNQEKAEETHQKAIEAYQEVPKSDRQAYAWTQYKLGALYDSLGQQNEAKNV